MKTTSIGFKKYLLYLYCNYINMNINKTKILISDKYLSPKYKVIN